MPCLDATLHLAFCTLHPVCQGGSAGGGDQKTHDCSGLASAEARESSEPMSCSMHATSLEHLEASNDRSCTESFPSPSSKADQLEWLIPARCSPQGHCHIAQDDLVTFNPPQARTVCRPPDSVCQQGGAKAVTGVL